MARARASVSKKKGVTIALSNQKGGVGKSVSTTNLACAFGKLGKSVLLVDADYQGNASSQIGMKDRAEELDKTITSGLLDEKKADTIWLKTAFKNVYVVAANQEFSEFNIQYLAQPGSHGILDDWLEPARAEFDIIIIDTHPSLDLTFQNVMVASDYYMLPLFAEPESMEGLHVMLKHVSKIQSKLNPTLHILGCFVTKYDKSIKTHERFCKSIKEFGNEFGMPLLGIIPFSKAIPSSSESEAPIVSSGQANWPVVKAYMSLAKKILPELKPARRGRTPQTPKISKEQVMNLKKSVKVPRSPSVVIEEEIQI